MIVKDVREHMANMLKTTWQLFVILALILFVVYLTWFFLPYDNEIEQFAEKVIENKTGIELDLSP